MTAPASAALRPNQAAPQPVNLRSFIKAELPSLLDIRHDLHRHPELSFQEKRTSLVVQRELKALKIRFKAGLGGGTGVLAHLPATDARHNTSPAVALRADMDALPIVEQTGLDYASENNGVMHACGHDGHTTILLGAARVLSKIDRHNPVTLLFQPAEEGGGGAAKMCDEGALAGEKHGGLGPPVARIFGLHGWPNLDLGTVASRPGPLLAAVDDFAVKIRGVQSHGAYPHFGRDPILAAAHVITALQSIASRNVGPLDSIVVTIGAINAGTANNIIPEEASFIGTVRTLKPETKALARERFFALVEQTALAFGCTAIIDWHEGYPVTINDTDATNEFFDTARTALDPARVHLIDQPTMGGEDFSFYGRHAKACFFLLGLKPPGKESVPTLHQPDFDFNDDALPLGVEMMTRLATKAFSP